jgi:UDP-N-acetylmuramate dehydrogenase
MHVRENVPLAPLTSLRVGGEAKRFLAVASGAELVDAVLRADAAREPVLVLGGGTNLVVGDAGWNGTVVHIASRGVSVEEVDGAVHVTVEAGEPWDDLVARAVGEGWSGVECLSGIPGLVGATPIQNVGAYGQEVGDTLVSVRVLDRVDRAVRDIPAAECAFAYRASTFKGNARFLVTRVTFELPRSRESAPLRYAELTRALGIAAGARAPLGTVRETVIALRKTKGMVIDPADLESVSAGSFFVNPLLDPGQLAALEARIASRAIDPASLPRFPGEGDLVKVPAAWLIEKAGFGKGWSPPGAGRVCISRKHALALVNRGGATAADVLACARAIQDGVRDAFGVTLSIEPVVV